MSSLALADRTPPPGSAPQESSPISGRNPYHLQEMRDEVQKFVTIKAEEFNSKQEFRLSVGYLVDTQSPHTISFSEGNFLEEANKIAEVLKEALNAPDLLVFNDTEHKTPTGHVTDTRCRPDIIAAFKRDWKPKGNIIWPLVQLVGEVASGGSNRTQQVEKANSYFYYLLLARPDLYTAQGLFISDSKIIFILGTGGVGLQTLSVPWKDKDLYGLLYAFIYRVYNPAPFADPMYIKTDKASGAYTLRIAREDIPGFNHIYGRNPFSTRTHVLSNPTSQFSIRGKIVTVIKDQLCRVGRRFEELEILETVHKPVSVPGVVEAVYGEVVTTPETVDLKGRCKRRLGLSESGSPFTSIPTPRRMLETVFDLLEVLRYMYSERRVLHRDISAGNVLYVEDSSSRTFLNRQSVPAQETAANKLPCFVKFLLDDSKNPLETSLLLVDFNLAEHLDSKTDCKRIGRTGTPIFMARAVEQNGPMKPSRFPVPVVPESPGCYTSSHQERIKKFEGSKEITIDLRNQPASQGEWRHGLEHDAESVFWLLVYWAVMARPKPQETKPKEEYINPIVFPTLIGDSDARHGLIISMSEELWLKKLTHSVYSPLATLISQLSNFLLVDRHWLSDDDCRKRPDYLNEAFQRVILQFIIKNRAASFMDHAIGTTLRSTAEVPQSGGKTSVPSVKRDAEQRSSQASGQATKRPRVDTEAQ